MTVEEFSTLDELTQIETFWEGSMVGERRNGGFVIMCRQVQSFYIEYKMLGGYYLQCRLFTNTDFLAPYLDMIDIRSLYKKDS